MVSFSYSQGLQRGKTIMVTSEPETSSSRGREAESALQTEQQKNNNAALLSSLGRQSSIYSLTLDEFQHTLCESGKNFGSMNMDEFLTSIWTAEENHQQANNNNGAASSAYVNGDNHHHNHNHNHHLVGADTSAAPPTRQQSLTRQGSLTLPAPLCRKTVDEVWSEIHSKGTQPRAAAAAAAPAPRNSEITPRQPTFGEMTLEDFLVKAGVVREQSPAAATPVAPPPPYGMFPATGAVGPGFAARPVGTFGDVARNGGSAPATIPIPAPGSGYEGRVGNVGGFGAAGPVSPVSSDGQFWMEMGALRGRKRTVDGPVEKVVERRQRRMIKNRESAARSRARKQAYTVELEAELNQLREENLQLKQALMELERKQKQQNFEENRMITPTKASKVKEKLTIFRRNMSCPL